MSKIHKIDQYLQLQIKGEFGYYQLKKLMSNPNLEQQLNVLRQYNKALEAQNESRNQERKVLEQQIQRLRLLEKNPSICQHCQQHKNKINQLESQLFKERYTITNLRTQINKLQIQSRTTLNIESSKQYLLLSQKYKELESKYNYLQSQHKIITSKTTVSQSSSLQAQRITEQKNKLLFEKENLQNKIKIIQSDLSIAKSDLQEKDNELKRFKKLYETLQQEKKSTDTIQISKFKEQIFNFQREVKEKQAIITSLQIKNEEKNKQVMRMDTIVTSYVEKINRLSQQLEKIALSNAHSQQLSTLANQNYVLNEKISDLERRIYILQETNANLQQQLKLSIQARKTASTITVSRQSRPQDDFKILIRQLKAQLNEAKGQNHDIRLENQKMHEKISQLQVKRSPRTKQRFTFDIKRNSSPVSYKQMNQIIKQPKSNLQKERYDSLQKKINTLKKQNAGLKRHLFDKKL